MAKLRTCSMCHARIKQNVAAHDCPHGNPCRYLCGDNGMPVDWTSPECPDCRGGAGSLRQVSSLALTDKALNALAADH